MKKTYVTLAISLVLSLGCATVNAHPLAWSMSSEYVGSIGDQINSQLDKLFITGHSGDTGGSKAPQDVATLSFQVGVNEYYAQNTPITGELDFTFTFNGVQKKNSLAYSWVSPGNGTVDYITFKAPASLTYGYYLVTFEKANTLSSRGGTVQEELYATIIDPPPTIPEPTSIALLTLGLLGFGVLLRKKTRKVDWPSNNPPQTKL